MQALKIHVDDSGDEEQAKNKRKRIKKQRVRNGVGYLRYMRWYILEHLRYVLFS